MSMGGFSYTHYRHLSIQVCLFPVPAIAFPRMVEIIENAYHNDTHRSSNKHCYAALDKNTILWYNRIAYYI